VYRILLVLALAACKKDDPTPPAGKVELVAATRGAVADIVKSQAERRVIVYVGAAWCEPCVAFHEAALAGRLDEHLGDVRFVEFDFDRDQDRLEAAGYRSKMLPLFAVPREDGTASGRQIEGSNKEDPLGNLVPRLRALLGP
jgi:hypothetical protein